MPSSPLPSQQEGWRTEFHLGALPLGFPSNLLPPPPPPQEAGEILSRLPRQSLFL